MWAATRVCFPSVPGSPGPGPPHFCVDPVAERAAAIPIRGTDHTNYGRHQCSHLSVTTPLLDREWMVCGLHHGDR